MQVVADSSALSFPSIDLSTSLRQHCLSLNQISEVHKPIPDFQPAGLLEQDHLSLFNSTSQLAHYNVSVVDFNSIFCDALLAHKSSLVLVHIYCSRVSEDQFRNANTVLSSCPLLRSFALVPKRPASRPEDSLALFEKPWNCPDLMILKLLGFKPTRVDDLNQRLSEAFIAQLEHEEKHGRHLILEEQPSAADSSNASISQWTRALASYSLPDPKFLEKISQAGWTKGEKVYKDDAPVLEDERRCSSRLEKIVEDKVFERVLALPHMRDVTLEEFIYRKKARRSVPTKAISNE
ncbi:hypothetical protein BG003_004020 [Podila horticola]|nr:hypothetical protein BG003_004020 [Podila horticola]